MKNRKEILIYDWVIEIQVSDGDQKKRYSRTTIISEGNISNVTDMSISFERE